MIEGAGIRARVQTIFVLDEVRKWNISRHRQKKNIFAPKEELARSDNDGCVEHDCHIVSNEPKGIHAGLILIRL